MLDQRSAALAAAYRANGWWRDRTLVDDFLDASTERLDRAAVVTYRSGHPEPETITYRQLRRYVDRMAGALLDLGVQPGDVVSMQLPNGWEFVALSLACARVGAVVNPLVPIFRHRELTFILGRTQARICVVPATFRGFAHGELLAQLARELPTLEHAFVLGAPGGSGGEGSLRRAAASRSTSSGAAGRTAPGCRPSSTGAGPAATTSPRSSSPPEPPASRRACSTPGTRSGRPPGPSPRSWASGPTTSPSWPRPWPTRPASSTASSPR